MKYYSNALVSAFYLVLTSSVPISAQTSAPAIPKLTDSEKLAIATVRAFDACVADAEAQRAVRFKPYYEALERYREEYEKADEEIRRQAPLAAKARVGAAVPALREAARLMGKSSEEAEQFLRDVQNLEEFKFRHTAPRPEGPARPPGYEDLPDVICHYVLEDAGFTHNDLIRKLSEARKRLGHEEYQRVNPAP